MWEQKGLKSTPKITDIFGNKAPDTSHSIKRTSSTLSPLDDDPDAKKPNTSDWENGPNKIDYTQFLEPLLTQFKSLRESVENKMGSLEDAISRQQEEVSKDLHKIEASLTKHRAEITQELKGEILDNKCSSSHIEEENRILRKENDALKDRITQIESSQLKNNVIITGILKQQWETYHSN